MFTTISLLAFVGNLVPFQTGTAHYSDGAQIYQILSNGPWRDVYRVLRVAAATLVTNLRPRDYDIGAIERVGKCDRRRSAGLHASAAGTLLPPRYWPAHGGLARNRAG
jgi:hypothetical protein